MEPTPDTRPLAWDDLTHPQQSAFLGLVKILGAMAEDAGRTPPSREARSGHATANPHRSHRVAALSGGRGTGKTSVYLTLVQALEDTKRRRPPSSDPAVSALLDTLAPRVWVLPPVDFDPLPPGLPALEAVVGGFRRLAEGGAERCTPNVLDAWRRMHRLVAAGWDGEGLRRGERDLTEGVFDREEQLVGWLGLPEAWRAFVDAALENLPGEVSLVVLPIDDADMQTTRSSDLLAALRLLHHPRVAFLLLWDRPHAEDLAILACRRELARPQEEPDSLDLGRDVDDWAAELGRARVEKSVARGDEVDLSPLTLADALAFQGGALAGHLDTQEVACGWRGRLVPQARLGEALQRWPRAPVTGAIRLRALVQRLSAHARKARPETGGTPGARAAAAPDLGALLFGLLGEARLDRPWTTAAPVRAVDRVTDVTLDAAAEWVLVAVGGRPRWQELPRSDENKPRWRPAQNEELLFRELQHLVEPGGSLEDFLHGPHLAWALVVADAKVNAIAAWPLPLVPRSYGEHQRLLDRWRSRPPGPMTTYRLAHDWVRLCLWSLDLPDAGGPAEPGEEPDWEALLRHVAELADTVSAGGDRGEATRWYADYLLPLFGAPEYGLDRATRHQILTWAQARAAARPTRTMWGRAITSLREARLADAIKELAQLRDDWVPNQIRAQVPAPPVSGLISWLDEQDSGTWRVIVGGEPWFTGSNPKIASVWDALVGPAGGAGPSFFRPRWDTTEGLRWVLAAADRLFVRRGLADAREDLTPLASLAGFPAGSWAGAFWAATMRASGLPTDRAPASWVVERDGLLDLSAMPLIKPVAPVGHWTIGLQLHTGWISAAPAAWSWSPPAGLPPGTEEGVLALVLLLQSGCALGGVPFDKLDLSQVYEEVLPDATGTFPEGVPLPRFPAWASVALFRQRAALVLDARGVLPRVPERDLRRWTAFSVLEAAVRTANGSVPLPLSFHPVDASRWSDLSPAFRATEKQPAFAAWLTTVLPALKAVFGDEVDVLSHALSSPAGSPD